MDTIIQLLLLSTPPKKKGTKVLSPYMIIQKRMSPNLVPRASPLPIHMEIEREMKEPRKKVERQLAISKIQLVVYHQCCVLIG